MLFMKRPISVRPRPSPFSAPNLRSLQKTLPVSRSCQIPSEVKTMARGKRSYWLLKTEPSEWSWDDQRANGGASQWDGVRNRQAVNHLKSMRPGDLCFFYHSGSGGASRRIVGVVRVTKPWYLIGDGDIDGAVDVKEVGEMRRHVELKEIKKAAEKEKELKGFALIKQPRLSVVPVADWVWELVCEMGGGFYEGDENDDSKEEKNPEE